MFKYRAISFPLLLALLGVIFFWPRVGGWIFLVIAPLTGALLAYELCGMIRTMKIPAAAGFAAAATAFIWLLPTFLAVSDSIIADRVDPIRITNLFSIVCGCAVLLLAAALWVVVFMRKPQILVGALTSLGVVFLLTVTFIPLIVIYPESIGGGNVSALFFLLAVSKSMDTGGYIAGMMSSKLLKGGNHKIAPSISPGKSWEGFFGGLALSIGVALLFCRFAPELSRGGAVFYGVLLALGSFFGDLTESALKRSVKVKDSANWLPGMGGAFDVADSLIYNGWLFIGATLLLKHVIGE